MENVYFILIIYNETIAQEFLPHIIWLSGGRRAYYNNKNNKLCQQQVMSTTAATADICNEKTPSLQTLMIKNEQTDSQI